MQRHKKIKIALAIRPEEVALSAFLLNSRVNKTTTIEIPATPNSTRMFSQLKYGFAIALPSPTSAKRAIERSVY